MESYVTFRCSAEDKALIERVAELQRMDVSSFVRDTVLNECRRAPTPFEAAVEDSRERLFGYRRRF
jgi:uncharacterized protein (DUF1778 family)